MHLKNNVQGSPRYFRALKTMKNMLKTKWIWHEPAQKVIESKMRGASTSTITRNSIVVISSLGQWYTSGRIDYATETYRMES